LFFKFASFGHIQPISFRLPKRDKHSHDQIRDENLQMFFQIDLQE